VVSLELGKEGDKVGKEVLEAAPAVVEEAAVQEAPVEAPVQEEV
jgi:hypothetical protein